MGEIEGGKKEVLLIPQLEDRDFFWISALVSGPYSFSKNSFGLDVFFFTKFVSGGGETPGLNDDSI